MTELEFINNVTGQTIAEFEGSTPNQGDTIVLSSPYYEDEDHDRARELSYTVLNVRRYYYENKRERYEFAQVTVARCE